MAEVSRRAADVVNVSFKVRQLGHPLRFPQQRFVAAVLDNPALMARNSAKVTVAEAAALARQAELYFLQGRHAAGLVVHGMPAPLKGQLVNGVHFLRRQRQGRRRLHDKAVFRRLDNRPAVIGILLFILDFKGLGKGFFVVPDFFIGRHMTALSDKGARLVT